MQDLGLNLIAILFLVVFIILVIWLLTKVGRIIDLIKSERKEIVNVAWCQEQLSNFTDEELRELKNQLNLNQ